MMNNNEKRDFAGKFYDMYTRNHKLAVSKEFYVDAVMVMTGNWDDEDVVPDLNDGGEGREI